MVQRLTNDRLPSGARSLPQAQRWETRRSLGFDCTALSEKRLRKIPFDFHYRCLCDTAEGEKEHRHKIVDWEAGALFWKCRRSHGADWETPFRSKLEDELGNRDLMFLMGNQHRFQDQWLIVSLIYPPRPKSIDDRQISLF